MLCDHAARPEFTGRWQWSDGDIAIWDNHFVQHYALGDFGAARRKIHRTETEENHPSPRAHFGRAMDARWSLRSSSSNGRLEDKTP